MQHHQENTFWWYDPREGMFILNMNSGGMKVYSQMPCSAAVQVWYDVVTQHASRCLLTTISLPAARAKQKGWRGRKRAYIQQRAYLQPGDFRLEQKNGCWSIVPGKDISDAVLLQAGIWLNEDIPPVLDESVGSIISQHWVFCTAAGRGRAEVVAVLLPGQQLLLTDGGMAPSVYTYTWDGKRPVTRNCRADRWLREQSKAA